MSGPPEGYLPVDKPPGPTSHDIVQRVRRVLGQPRAGHAGTLDPAASGLLPIMLGRATRLVRFLPDGPKRYEGSLRLGLTTATDDLEGEVVLRSPAPVPAAEQVHACSLPLRGRIRQVPPAFSAKKVGGRRLYDLARQGRSVEAPAVEVEVFRFDLLPTADPAEWDFVAEVSAGTYIRALVRDLGRALGCGGALATLRRTAIGPLKVADAVVLDDEAEGARMRLVQAIIPIDSMPLAPAGLQLGDPVDARRFVAGLSAAASIPSSPGLRCVRDPVGQLLGVGEISGDLVLPRVVIAIASPGRVSRPSH